VENIGYKRTKRGEKSMPNELYRVNDKGEVLVDDGKKEKALDYLRDIKWD
jgi:type I restriction enzyme M protein